MPIEDEIVVKKELFVEDEKTEIKRSSKEKANILEMIKEKRPNKPIIRNQRKSFKG